MCYTKVNNIIKFQQFLWIGKCIRCFKMFFLCVISLTSPWLLHSYSGEKLTKGSDATLSRTESLERRLLNLIQTLHIILASKKDSENEQSLLAFQYVWKHCINTSFFMIKIWWLLIGAVQIKSCIYWCIRFFSLSTNQGIEVI